MRYIGDFPVNSVVRGSFNSRKADGTPITLAGSPALSVYKGNSTTESTTGVTLTVDFDSRTGHHYFAIDTSADGTFYSTGTDFRIVITAGTVDSISVVGVLVAAFSLENRNKKVDVDTIKTNPVVNGGTVTFPISATLASTANITSIGNVTGNVNGSVGSVSNYGTLVADVATAVWGATTRTLSAIADSTGVGTLLTRLTSTRAGFLDNLDPTVGVKLNATQGLYAPAKASDIPTASQIAAEVDVALVNTGDGTDLLQAIANQIAADWVAGDASPLAVVAALTANATFIQLVSDAAASKVAAQAVNTKVVGTIATGTHNPQSGDSFARLGAPTGVSIAADIGTRLATSGYTAPPSAAANAAAVWDLTVSGHTTSGTFGAAMNAAGSAGDPWATTLPGAYDPGTAGFIVGTNLNATVASRSVLSTGDIDARLNAYDSPTNAEMVAAFTQIKGSTFNSATDSLEAIRDRGDAAWITGSGGGGGGDATLANQVIIKDNLTTLLAELATVPKVNEALTYSDEDESYVVTISR